MLFGAYLIARQTGSIRVKQHPQQVRSSQKYQKQLLSWTLDRQFIPIIAAPVNTLWCLSSLRFFCRQP